MVESVKQTINRNKRDSIPGSYMQFPEKMGAHGMLFMFRDYKFKDTGTRQLLKSSDIQVASTSSILLPIPVNLQDSNELRLSRMDMDIWGDLRTQAAAEAIDATGDFSFSKTFSNFMSMNPLNGKAISDALFNSGEGRQNLARDARYIMRKYLPTDIGRNFDVAGGMTLNPKAALTFEGTELKTHSFQWNLYPQNERESEALKTIINTMKRRELPKYGGGALERTFLYYPNTVDVFLLGVDEDHFMKYKTSMVRSLNISPTAQGGLALLEGGKPASVTIDMILMEMDIHTAEDYESGNFV